MASMEEVDDAKRESSKPGGDATSQPNTTTASEAMVGGQHSTGGAPAVVGDFQMFPRLVYAQNQEEVNHGPGLYAVPVSPFMGPSAAGYPPNTLIPLTYRIPTRQHPDAARIPEERGQVGPQQQNPAPQRQVEWRFHVAIQLDLLLILKLAAFVYLLGRDGSRQRLFLLAGFASLIYLYQTGVLNPLVEWLSQRMQRLAAPPRPPRQAAARAQIAPPAPGQGNENAAIPGGQPEAGNEGQPLLGGDGVAENENGNGPPGVDNGGNRWWGIVKEIQVIVFGFITSLLPGFHNVD